MAAGRGFPRSRGRGARRGVASLQCSARPPSIRSAGAAGSSNPSIPRPVLLWTLRRSRLAYDRRLGNDEEQAGRGRLSMSNETLDGRSGQDRRSGLNRRISERRDESRALARYPLARTGVDCRRAQRRLAARRATIPRGIDTDRGTASNGLLCPDCEAPLHDLFALQWISPRTDTIDGGYCSSCSRQFIRSRATGRYERWSCGRSH
jgi:hypothetical protein